MWNSTGVVGYIAILMTVGASLVSGNGTNAYYASRADAFSARTRIENVTEQKRLGDSQYVRIYVNGMAYEGTVHIAR